ncbi:MAG: multidrug efflux SMR transporter [Myxococcaceae bacterium]|nr:multidrug efflux SMR transporter [Myxococcaceae bacterium]
MAWVLLIIAAGFECGWAVALKYTEGFTRLWPTVAFGACMLLSVGLLGRAARDLPIGTAYAVWTGLGAAATAIVGMILFDESKDWRRVVCLGLVLTGTAGLKLFARS